MVKLSNCAFVQAYNCYVEALRIQPKFAIAWSNLAGLFMEAGDLKRALQYYKASNPDFFLSCLGCVCVCVCTGKDLCILCVHLRVRVVVHVLFV
jgi:hypothetical protein